MPNNRGGWKQGYWKYKITYSKVHQNYLLHFKLIYGKLVQGSQKYCLIEAFNTFSQEFNKTKRSNGLIHRVMF